jgi:hypothetical protein
MKSLSAIWLMGSFFVVRQISIEPKEVFDEDFVRPRVEIADLGTQHNGKEVVMKFKVKGTHMDWTPVTLTPGQAYAIRSFKMTAVAPEGSPRFSVLVSGDLADVMGRFGMSEGSDTVKGIVVKAAGKITVFPAPKDDPTKGKSFQLHIHDWKLFRIVEARAK